MRLDFNVLWVEDQQQAVQAQCVRIERLINQEGFRLQVRFAASIDEAKKYLCTDIYGDHIDLVLMDYDLGTGGWGDDGLEMVRNIFPYKDIIFYSAKAPDLPKMVADKRVDGVYCSPRDELPDTVDGVFEALVKKVLDIDHSRGIVMGATSDIDHYVNDCLAARFNGADDEGRASALKVVRNHAESKKEHFEKELDKLLSTQSIEELQQLHNIYTSNDRLRLLNKFLEADSSQKDNVSAIKEYIQNTVPKRNDLAHVRVIANGFSRKLFDRHGKELTSAQMKEFRQELLKFQDLFEQLSDNSS